MIPLTRVGSAPDRPLQGGGTGPVFPARPRIRGSPGRRSPGARLGARAGQAAGRCRVCVRVPRARKRCRGGPSSWAEPLPSWRRRRRVLSLQVGLGGAAVEVRLVAPGWYCGDWAATSCRDEFLVVSFWGSLRSLLAALSQASCSLPMAGGSSLMTRTSPYSFR